METPSVGKAILLLLGLVLAVLAYQVLLSTAAFAAVLAVLAIVLYLAYVAGFRINYYLKHGTFRKRGSS